ncbi:FecR family protein [Pinibacter aurantiacus]|uniref:FecR domain-containing protein n=1 Tax=Pinibacter aurantiacus TaxID=2851599 RepID=A0A9E2SCD4_9BACT|nr:FecR family protein [Pinibacter aurantiacus]MBV4360396.1 FecR domain-containing protein [Pinibacter aurantiacus]
MNEDFAELLNKYLNKTITQPEMVQMARLLELPECQLQLAAFIDENLEGVPFNIAIPEPDAEGIYRQVLNRTGQNSTARVVSISRRISKLKWTAAAVVILAIGTTAYFSFFKRSQSPELAELSQQQRYKNDIAPAKQGVILTLDDGSTKMLDTVASGDVIIEGMTKAIKQGESISFSGNKSSEVAYNTIATQKGKMFHLQLADGTDVWLDALSSIHFPTVFPGSERLVEVTGQAYFEVAKNPKQPFKVKVGTQTIDVLGTHFNVNSYDDHSIQTTLLEGAVKVNANGDSKLMQPGQQAKVAGGAINISDAVDMNEVMAWKEGRFEFNKVSVEEMMNQLARWYDIEVVYKDTINKTFVAEIQRDMPVSELLKLLEMTKQIKFSIEGNKVTIMKW